MSDYLLVAEPQFIHFSRPDLASIEIREQWINPAAIAMVAKHQRGNVFSVDIVWVSGKTTNIKDTAAAKVFLDKWEAWHGRTRS